MCHGLWVPTHLAVGALDLASCMVHPYYRPYLEQVQTGLLTAHHHLVH